MAERSGQLLWSRSPRRPKATREQIAATALAIADAEGIEAVTMRRLAGELHAGTMTLYHYVASKGELVALMLDAIMAEQLVPAAELPEDDWRAALTALAHHTRAMLRRHPWALAGLIPPTGGTGGKGGTGSTGGTGGAAGPHALRHFEQSLAAVASTGLPPEDRLDVIGAVDDYVAGFVLKTDLEPGLESVPEEAAPAVAEYLDTQLATGEYPHVAALLTAGGNGESGNGESAGSDSDRWAALRRLGAANDPDRRFERGIRRLLDGVAAQIARATGQAPG